MGRLRRCRYRARGRHAGSDDRTVARDSTNSILDTLHLVGKGCVPWRFSQSRQQTKTSKNPKTMLAPLLSFATTTKEREEEIIERKERGWKESISHAREREERRGREERATSFPPPSSSSSPPPQLTDGQGSPPPRENKPEAISGGKEGWRKKGRSLSSF